MFDYRVIQKCQYEALDIHNNPHSCGEPASYQVWWKANDRMYVCQEHFDYIKKCEEEE